MNSSEDDGENLENLACSVVSTSIRAAKKNPTPAENSRYNEAMQCRQPHTDDYSITDALVWRLCRQVNIPA